MSLRMTDAPVPVGEHVPTADRRIIMRGLSWSDYRTLQALRREPNRPRMAYLDGVVEIMSPSRGHEGTKSNVGRLVEAYCLERGIDFSPYGAWQLDDESEEANAQPDECYVFGRAPQSIPLPELVIEVVWTRGGINKLEIFRRLGVGEVWYWVAGSITVYLLGADRQYAKAERSRRLPDLDVEMIAELARIEPTSEAIRQLRERLR